LVPENIFLDSEGFIRLVDFELAKVVSLGEATHTLCGVCEYMSPEMLLCRGHNYGADWWAFGILLFEMLTGHTPFEDNPYRRVRTHTHATRSVCGIAPDAPLLFICVPWTGGRCAEEYRAEQAGVAANSFALRVGSDRVAAETRPLKALGMPKGRSSRHPGAASL